MAFTILGTSEHAGRVAVDLHVPPDSPFFRGHFPRHPLLPAVAELDLAARLAHAHLGTPRHPHGVRGLRLRGQVEPGTDLHVTLTPSSDGHAVGVAVAVAARPVAQGTLLYDGAGVAEAALGDPAPAPLPAIDAPALEDPPLPHRGVARLVEAILLRDGDHAVCRARIPTASPFVEAGRAPAVLAIELGAQATAAHEVGGPAPEDVGRVFLVSVREARFATETLPTEEPLLVVARRVALAPPLRTTRVEVRPADGGAPLATATVGTWVPETS